MHMQNTVKYIDRVRNWSLRKKIIYGIILVLIVFLGIMIFKPKDNSANITTDTARVMNLKQTILATGQVTSNTDLDLSFFSSGVVRSIKVKIGDEVREGQILATLDQGNELASLTSARGAVAAAEAKYKRILDGASREEIKLAQVALENAKLDYERVKSQQATLVKSAYKNLLNSTPEALPKNGGSDYTAPTISGNYTKETEGQIFISTYYSGSGSKFDLGGIIQGGGNVTTTIPQPLGDSGLYINFPSTTLSNTREWVIDIPNKKASNYITNENAYKAALKTEESVLGTAQALISQREAELSLKQSAARPAELDLAKADILSAQGQFQSASANFEHTILRAPAKGTITKIDVKIGELAQALKSIMTLEDVRNIYLEANINEANITSIKTGDIVDITFDAFGSEKVFKGNILKIEPSSTVISGVVNYKVTANVISPPDLRPGMTANMTILAEEKNNVLVVPSRAIMKDKTNKKTVRLVTNSKTKTFEEVDVTTGMEGDGGLTEILSGLSANDEVVVLIKK